MKTAIRILLTVLTLSIASVAMAQVDGVTSASPIPRAELYPIQPDTIYLLPGEYFWTQYGVWNTVEEIYTVDAWYNIGQFRQALTDFNFETNGEHYESPGTFYRESWDQGVDLWGTLKWVPSHSWEAPRAFWLWGLYGYWGLGVGDSVQATFSANIGNAIGSILGDAKTQYLVGIDGIRGDINRDGVVDTTDVRIGLAGLNQTFDYTGRYTKDGINYGLGTALFSRPNMLDLAFINMYANDPTDPAVQNLGIGKLMSERPVIQQESFASTMSDRTLIVKTKAFAVMATAITSNGKEWNSAVLVKNGLVKFDLPESGLKYQIQAVSVEATTTDVESQANQPAKFILNQNYPNPFNPPTTIEYAVPKSGPVSLKVYDLLGKEVATMVSENQAAGNHTADFDGSMLSSGTYIYRLVVAGKTETKKMILAK
jgi:hypothetical protein